MKSSLSFIFLVSPVDTCILTPMKECNQIIAALGPNKGLVHVGGPLLLDCKTVADTVRLGKEAISDLVDTLTQAARENRAEPWHRSGLSVIKALASKLHVWQPVDKLGEETFIKQTLECFLNEYICSIPRIKHEW